MPPKKTPVKKDETVEFYCVKCKAKKEVSLEDTKQVQTKNKRWMLKTSCPDCKTTMCKFIKKPE